MKNSREEWQTPPFYMGANWMNRQIYTHSKLEYVRFLYLVIYTVNIHKPQSTLGRLQRPQRAFWSSLSFQFRQRIKLRNQSPVWSALFTVGSGCWLINIRTESPLESCCLLFPSKETHALLLASSGICPDTKKFQNLQKVENTLES